MIWNRTDDECHRLVDQYADWMKFELDENWQKGDRRVWKDYSVDDCFGEIRTHLDKLENAMWLGDKEKIREYAADVGNCTMIFLDVMNLIEPVEVRQPPPPTWSTNDYESSNYEYMDS